MRIRYPIALLGVLLLIAAGAHAQGKPDFSGTWAAVPESWSADVGPKQTLPNLGPTLSFDHKGDALTLHRTIGGLPATIHHKLDGSEVQSRMPARLCEPDSGATWKAAWDNDAVAIAMVSAMPPNGKPVAMDVRTRLRLESPDTLRAEVTAAARVDGKPVLRTTTTLYKRTSPIPAIPAASGATPAKATLDRISWLPGIWIGTRGSGTFEERWTPAGGGSMLAVARGLGNGLMNSFEFLCIAERNGGLVYTAMPQGRSPATEFILTEITDTSIVFENPTHDFPKKVQYTRKGDADLEAVVSGAPGSKPQVFSFRRQ